ncbi:hypothetical protein [Lonsdalea quercina]|uniref:hypothetical protein n=1 Tax=Lonsdalea quercina TaxID=71657 RepID=UPI003975C95F
MIRDEVIEALKAHGELNITQIFDHCSRYHRSKSGVYTGVRKMTHDGAVIRCGEEGSYTYRLAPQVELNNNRFDTRSHNPLVLLFDRRIREVRSDHEVGMATH